MRLLVVLCCFFSAVPITAQPVVGTGLVSIEFDEKTSLYLFHGPSEKRLFRNIKFFYDESVSGPNIYRLNELSEWLKPELLWLDYASFVFRCKSTHEDWYEVVVDNFTGTSYWIKKSATINFLTWEEYLNNMFSIERSSTDMQKIRSRPDDDAEEITYEGEDCFKARSVKGDWIEIYSPEYCQDGYTDSETVISSGWIRWKKDDKLLIRYYITS